jgi:UDP-N-acetylglucosamine 2-epimerase (non-hydrolysing)
MIRILSVIGTRPEAIKMAPVIRALAARPDAVESIVCSTGQHREMLRQVLEPFGIMPDHDLDLMTPSQTPTQMAARLLARIGPLLDDLRPDWVLVQGDTTTVMATAIAAHHARVRIGHVEAGLRTGDRWNPFPEEMNRVLTDHLSDLCFAPTVGARDALLREGIAAERILVTGNTVVDALQWIADLPWQPDADLAPLLSDSADLVLVTAHRRESFGAPLARICAAIRELALAARGRWRLIYPVHPNPQVQGPVYEALQGIPGVSLLPPLDYLSLINLLGRARLVLTDSGGIQEEAPTFGAPVLVLRDATERPEGVAAGVARLVGTDTQRIVAEALRLLTDDAAHTAMARAANPYGDGRASERIVEAVVGGGRASQGEPDWS